MADRPDIPEEERATTAESVRQPTAHERNARDAVAVARMAREVRGMLADAPEDDPEVADILRDCEALDRAAQFLNTKPIEMKGGKLMLTTVASRFSAAPALRKQGAEEAERERDEAAQLSQQRLDAQHRTEERLDEDRERWAARLQEAQVAAMHAEEKVRDLEAVAEKERDQAIAKGAEEERERLRGVIEEMDGHAPDERHPGAMRDDDGGCWLRDVDVLAALDTPAPSEPEASP